MITKLETVAETAMGKLTDCTEASGLKDICAELGGSDRRILEGGCCSDQYY